MGFLRKMLGLFVVAGSVILLTGCATLDEDPSGTYTLDLEGRVAVLVVDNSGGPEEFDPDGLIREGAKFLLSTFSDADNVGIVTVRFPVKALLPITHLAQDDARETAREALKDMKIGGDAEYYEALKKAKELLEIFSAQRDSCVVFLTGGLERPSGNPQEIRDLMKLFGDRGWRFFPVVLTPAPDLLGVLESGAALTQGAVFKIERPDDILSSLVTVSGKINDLWVHRGLEPTAVYDGTKRLLMAVTQGDQDASIEQVTRDDQVVDLEGNEKASLEESEAFDTVTLPDPPAGTWAGKVKGEPTSEAMMAKAPFRVYLDDDATVKGSALEGDEIPFDLVVEGEMEDIKAWAPKGYASVTLVSESTG
ncbi:MAG: vWA domain-containing protein, partial [Planctomycetota bacterium]